MAAQLTTKSADLATEFGLSWATKLFGEEAIASLEIRKSGKNKGAPKGFIVWRKAATSGYCREVCGPVAAGQIVDAWVGEGPLSTRNMAVRGNWLGCTQALASSGYYLFAEGRARDAADKARARADTEEMIRDMEAARAARG